MRDGAGGGGGLLVLLQLLLWWSSHVQTLRRYSTTRGGVPGHVEAIARAMRRACDIGLQASGMTRPEAWSVKISTIIRSSSIVCRLAGCQ